MANNSIIKFDDNVITALSIEEIHALLLQTITEIYNVNVSSDSWSADSIYQKILAQYFLDFAEVAEETYNMIRLDAAYGSRLDALVSLLGLKRKPNSYAKIRCSVAYSSPVTIPSDGVLTFEDQNGSSWYLLNESDTIQQRPLQGSIDLSDPHVYVRKQYGEYNINTLGDQFILGHITKYSSLNYTTTYLDSYEFTISNLELVSAGSTYEEDSELKSRFRSMNITGLSSNTLEDSLKASLIDTFKFIHDVFILARPNANLDVNKESIYGPVSLPTGVITDTFIDGEQWFDEDINKLYTYDELTGWDDGVIIPTTMPGSPINGDRWFDETVDKLYTYVTSAWDSGVTLPTVNPVLTLTAHNVAVLLKIRDGNNPLSYDTVLDLIRRKLPLGIITENSWSANLPSANYKEKTFKPVPNSPSIEVDYSLVVAQPISPKIEITLNVPVMSTAALDGIKSHIKDTLANYSLDFKIGQPIQVDDLKYQILMSNESPNNPIYRAESLTISGNTTDFLTYYRYWKADESDISFIEV